MSVADCASPDLGSESKTASGSVSASGSRSLNQDAFGGARFSEFPATILSDRLGSAVRRFVKNRLKFATPTSCRQLIQAIFVGSTWEQKPHKLAGFIFTCLLAGAS
jgi:hypothetical protein